MSPPSVGQWSAISFLLRLHFSPVQPTISTEDYIHCLLTFCGADQPLTQLLALLPCLAHHYRLSVGVCRQTHDDVTNAVALGDTSVHPQARPIDVTSPSQSLQRSPRALRGRTTYTRQSLVVRLGLPLGADEMPDRTPELEYRTYRAHKGLPGVGRGRARYVLGDRELVRRFVQVESPVRVALIATGSRAIARRRMRADQGPTVGLKASGA
ncbi:hypothetical protein FRC07_011173 [Ceratobasidium sp. 392]|nr:hypothetical protein FRC07_011173 [Ceratobasidium sp. 392]